MAKLKVLQVGKFYPPHRGGMETHLEQLSRELVKSVDLEVVVSNAGPTAVTEMVGPVKVTRLAQRLQVASTSICPQMVQILRESDADVIHIHHPNPMATLAYLAAKPAGKLVVTYHSDIVRQKALREPFKILLQRVLSHAEAIIVSSPAFLEHSAVLAPFSARSHVIPFGVVPVDRDKITYDVIRTIRETYGPKIVLALGRMVGYKGFGFLVRAMSRVNGRALLIGSGPLRRELEAEAEKWGVRDRIVFLGNVPDVSPYYCAADVFVLPSITPNEAFGLVQLEAMSCGTPVINTRLNSGVPFVSPDGVTGLTVAPRDWEALAHAIQYLFDHDECRLEFGRQARARFQSHFSLDRMMEDTLALYYAVAGAKWSKAKAIGAA